MYAIAQAQRYDSVAVGCSAEIKKLKKIKNEEDEKKKNSARDT